MVVLKGAIVGLRCAGETASLVLIVLACTCGCLSLGKDALRSKETILKEDLYSMRNALDQFTQDKGRSPVALSDLVRAGYLHEIPQDPFTNSRLTWKVINEDSSEEPQDTPVLRPKALPGTRGITDVHSGSAQISSEGTRYSSW